MKFSQRVGAVPPSPIQIGSMDDVLRNRLYNSLNRAFPERIGYYSQYDVIRKYALDELGFNLDRVKNSDFNYYFLNGDWYVPYDIIEIVIEAILHPDEKSDFQSLSEGINSLRGFINDLQNILKEEKSGYRLLNNQFIPITNNEELNTLEEASNTKFESVNIHMRKAVTLFSNRKGPDYENSIKESISAVESLCCIITGEKGGQATLGKMLKKLEDKGVIIHKALQEAFKKLYGFSSDKNGIRHGGIDFTKAPVEDAKFMLISCSAFINYIIEKWCEV